MSKVGAQCIKRPAGPRKKDSPLGGGAWPKAAERPPVSEFESPKLNIAGKSQGALLLLAYCANELNEISDSRIVGSSSFGEGRGSIIRVKMEDVEMVDIRGRKGKK
ncbi:hypothetical protein STAS_00931 [Striga asiatica]|uniref:Uncharacterized protein n=1 Tax=Striga asiatica TaxID=4170 RepID=A0A5A7NYJ0_STRAF|nr:hypothetical protein STAS_00931 [Striga asiatica]